VGKKIFLEEFKLTAVAVC